MGGKRSSLAHAPATFTSSKHTCMTAQNGSPDFPEGRGNPIRHQERPRTRATCRAPRLALQRLKANGVQARLGETGHKIKVYKHRHDEKKCLKVPQGPPYMSPGPPYAYGSKLNLQDTTGFSHCFHLPGCNFGYLFLTLYEPSTRHTRMLEAPTGSTICKDMHLGVAQKPVKWNPGKWKHGPKPAVCPSCLILSHSQFCPGAAPRLTRFVELRRCHTRLPAGRAGRSLLLDLEA